MTFLAKPFRVHGMVAIRRAVFRRALLERAVRRNVASTTSSLNALSGSGVPHEGPSPRSHGEHALSTSPKMLSVRR